MKKLFQKGDKPWNRQETYKICETCKLLFHISPARLKKARYCSRECRGLADKNRIPWNKGTKGLLKANKTSFKKGSQINKGRHHSDEARKKMSISHGGDGVHFWKDNAKYDLGERQRFRNTIQKLVFERDNYTCQLCGVKGSNLQVDHIQSWAEYVELRFSMDNCRTLCAKCHYKITFGKEIPSSLIGWGHNLFKGGKYY